MPFSKCLNWPHNAPPSQCLLKVSLLEFLLCLVLLSAHHTIATNNAHDTRPPLLLDALSLSVCLHDSLSILLQLGVEPLSLLLGGLVGVTSFFIDVETFQG